MSIRTDVILCGVAACALSVATVDLSAQARGARGGAAGVQGGRTGAPAPALAVANAPDDPFSGPVVTNAPFSADGVTTVTQVLSDGTRIEENTTTKFYRDNAGRVRREQEILGLAALNPTGEPRITITIDPDPGDATAYTLDPANKTARRVSRSGSTQVVLRTYNSNLTSDQGLYVLNGNAVVAYNDALGSLTAQRETGDVSWRRRQLEAGNTVELNATRQPVESLGTRQMEGVTVVGRRTKSVIPTGQIGNDRPIEITDERWESADLKLLVRSHHHDPRTGDVEYRLTNIVRVEPQPDLFIVPSDYTIVGGRGGGLGAGTEPGLRTGGARGGNQSGGGARSGAPAN